MASRTWIPFIYDLLESMLWRWPSNEETLIVEIINDEIPILWISKRGNFIVWVDNHGVFMEDSINKEILIVEVITQRNPIV